MNKPRPKAELVITYETREEATSLLNEHTFFITVTSSDARDWVETNLPEFGKLNIYNAGSRYGLTIQQSVYDIDEMRAYIQSMGV